ncbi:MAG TPA: hypothetical protein VGR02_10520 [Thermoanaerobaculia bacterium]|jgi:hypothetical protein|nr:hypothetical protein [Thermoanaerobaculia bacterium]
MQRIELAEVNRIRGRIARAHALAADRFRAAFEAQPDWRLHLEIQAAALLEMADGVRLREGDRIAYRIDGRTITPYIVEGRPPWPYLIVGRTPAAILEYWLIAAELAAWAMTKLIADGAEYDAALARMQQPQLVRALIASFLPEVELRDDGTALLEVTVYTRADEERVERRLLVLEQDNEFRFHSRELIAEGRGGVRV